ncbi:SIMPL domain-containing protein [Glaciimonas immobilis]|uniref:Putative secreted protein n=1 Tax=Glaciimonas immobilis TaxID=728004 RepID=A0A840RXL4_9BURK|nr:SIMPL domain-containing protein [Glaciimonas immobilis]KAF3996646.1 SIMPL domain-containing protein [Glaciimonas immobilis]MBB5202655.1 putative secreted protein [Glaciimonas immobilis]
MSRYRKLVLLSFLTVASLSAHAQNKVQTTGALVVVPAYGEVRHANDQVRVTFNIEEQDKDKAAAASRVNLKMKQGTDILKRQDPQAILQTRGYYTYPVYPEETQPRASTSKPRLPTGWRVGQYLDATTTNLTSLPKTVAAVQSLLGLNGLNFGLSDATSKKLDDQRIAATYLNLNQRIGSIARAMGRSESDAVLDTIDFEGSGNYAPEGAMPKAAMMMRSAAPMDSTQVEEPSFEPGETTLTMRVVGKVRFK